MTARLVINEVTTLRKSRWSSSRSHMECISRPDRMADLAQRYEERRWEDLKIFTNRHGDMAGSERQA